MITKKALLTQGSLPKKINKFNMLYKVWNFDTLTFKQTTLKKLPGNGIG
jgi:hypothetical protein